MAFTWSLNGNSTVLPPNNTTTIFFFNSNSLLSKDNWLIGSSNVSLSNPSELTYFNHMHCLWSVLLLFVNCGN